ncbi:MAG: cyanophycin synthetase [Clostridiaceae bacterium]|nr:cyanophycin synthetase [Clostridiaceae bacterium]
MKIENARVFKGRNIHAHKKCIALEVNLEGYENIPSNEIDGFNEALLKILPELNDHRCGIDEEHGFVKRLDEGTYLGHICEHIILALQNKIGIPSAYGKTRRIKDDYYTIVFQYEYEKTALACGNIAVDMINTIIGKKPFNFEGKMDELVNILRAEEIGPSTKSIIEEAKKRGIPVIKTGEGSMFQLGYGKNSKVIEATIGCNTSAVAVDCACDKLITKEILYNQYIPIADGGKVRNPIDLIYMANKIGFPVVLKPRFGNQGKGVYVNIKNEKQLVEYYNELSSTYKEIIIEKYIQGSDYRVCVVDGKVVAAAQRIPPYVVGDGTHNIDELIKILNKDSRRGEGHEKPLTKVKADEDLINYIKKKNYNLYDVLPKGERLFLRENANLSTGGISIDCTDEICKDNIELCQRCASAIGLDICGIDVCCKDIKESIKNNGAVIEVNAAPGIRMHHYPYSGKSRNVAKAIVDMLFKDINKQIPLVAVTGTNGKTTTTRLISYILKASGYSVGMTSTGGIYINDECIDMGDTTGYDSALTILMNKNVDAAVLECARGGLIRNGLAYDLADVGVITNITEDHLGLNGIETLDELASVKSLVAEAVKDDGYVVLNADDHMSMTILPRIKSKIIMFSKSMDNEYLRKNLENNGIGIYINGDYIVLEQNSNIYPMVKINEIPMTLGGILEYNSENAMAACAALIGLGIDKEVIKSGLKSFYGNEECNPGRFNIYEVQDLKVILDYGHNIEGYKAVLKGAKKIPHNKLIGVIGVPGDRTNSSVLEVGRIAANNFDYIYIKEDQDKRGRKCGEIAELLKQGVLSTGFDKNKIKIIISEEQALNEAIDNGNENDLIITFFEKYEPLLKLINAKSEKIKKDLANFA